MAEPGQQVSVAVPSHLGYGQELGPKTTELNWGRLMPYSPLMEEPQVSPSLSLAIGLLEVVWSQGGRANVGAARAGSQCM